MQTNILGTKLEICCSNPLTGFYRDGLCRTSNDDFGTHTVCAIVTNEFLQYSKKMGNDLTASIPEYGFTGLKDGDRWCLCILRWIEAYKAGCAPKIDPMATSNISGRFIDKEVLLKYSI